MGKSTRIQKVNKDMFCSVQQDCIMNQVEKIYKTVLLSSQNMFDWLMDNKKIVNLCVTIVTQYCRGVEIVKFSNVQGQVNGHNVLVQRKFSLIQKNRLAYTCTFLYLYSFEI